MQIASRYPEMVVIGGGAAGICAAISARRAGKSVVICEKTAQLGKKILASGNGRCNLLNEDMSEVHYNPSARTLVRSIFYHFGKSQTLQFFHDLGLETYARDGRIFPVTNQATSVLKVLEMEIKRQSVPIVFNFDCRNISLTKNGIIISASEGKKLECQRVVITGGGRSYPKSGSDGSIFPIAQKLGHKIIEPVPSVVPLVSPDPLCGELQGQRINAKACSVIGGRISQPISGELLFTRYGLSGSCILDISEEISLAINRRHLTEVFVAVDFVPFWDIGQLKQALSYRKKNQLRDEEMLVGILPNKISSALRTLFRSNDTDLAAHSLKQRLFKISGTLGWDEAEFTSGGIKLSEVDNNTLASKIHTGIYFAGEVLDVNGQRGGYNLGWAWASGMVAGKAQ